MREDIQSAILETIARRPCTLVDLTNILGLHANEVNKSLDVLEADKRVSVTRQPRGQFYQICTIQRVGWSFSILIEGLCHYLR